MAQEDKNAPPSFEGYNFLDLYITEKGDTLPIIDLPLVSVSAKKLTLMEQSRYRKIKYGTQKVYPYAYQALQLLQEIEDETANMNRKRQQNKYIKSVEKELKQNFKEDLKKLTITQGKILVKLIERGTGGVFYEILKDMKSGTTAFIFQQVGKKYGYNLKDGYDAEKEWMIEKALEELEAEGKLKTEIEDKS